jgi:hypothetical protein
LDFRLFLYNQKRDGIYFYPNDFCNTTFLSYPYLYICPQSGSYENYQQCGCGNFSRAYGRGRILLVWMHSPQRVSLELEQLSAQQVQSLTSFDFILDALLQAAF